MARPVMSALTFAVHSFVGDPPVAAPPSRHDTFSGSGLI